MKLINNEQFSIGTDPEFFLVDSYGHYRSAIGQVPGDKCEPFLLPNKAGLQVDNVAVEFASPVATSAEEFLKHITLSIFHTQKQLPRGYSLSLTTAATYFPKEELGHPDAHIFGCTADYDAWIGKKNKKPDTRGVTLRTCGGHIHVGHSLLEDKGKRVAMVKAMDCIHGVLSSVLDTNRGSAIRRELYGKPGCFRITPYGIEYRTLSNYWLASKTLIRLMYYLTEDALRLINGELLPFLIGDLGGKSSIQDAILNEPSSEQLEATYHYLSTDSLALFNKAVEEAVDG